MAEDVVSEVVATITDPRQMIGPEALFSENVARDEAAKIEERNGGIEFHVIGNSLTQKVKLIVNFLTLPELIQYSLV